MKATDLLKQDHDTVKKLFDEYESARESAEDRAEIVEDVTEQLLIHSIIEEEIFYPAVSESEAEDAEAEVDKALDEHEQIKAILTELSEMDPEDEPTFSEKVMALKQNVDQHISEEEGRIFADARLLGDERLSELGEELESRKEELSEEGVDLEEEEEPSE